MAPEKTDEDGLPTEDAPGYSDPKAKQTFQADWREPNLLTIFMHDEHGRMQKKSQATIEEAFLSLDASSELNAMHFYLLDAAQAASPTIVTDGASGDFGSDREDRRAGRAAGGTPV